MKYFAQLHLGDLESAMITRSVTQCSSQEEADFMQTGSAFFPHTATGHVV